MMKRIKIILVATLLVATIVVGGIVYVQLDSPHCAYTGDADDGEKVLANDFTLPKVGGGSVSLSALRGKVVVLDFMATWCGPCETELSHLRDIANRYSNMPVEIISIDVDDSETDSVLTPYIVNQGISWTVLRDTTGMSNNPGYDVSSIPTIVIISKDGYISYRTVGVTEASEIACVIDGLL
jgi:thiol-disulfide isomerase/thioredoxin